MTSGWWTEVPEGPGGSGSGPRTGRDPGSLTLGAEEEYLLVDPVSRRLRPDAEKVVAEAAAELGGRVTRELTRYQVEVRTEPHRDLAAFAEELRSLRRAVARAAARHGLAAVSSGTPVLAQPAPTPFSEGARYARSVAEFGALDDEQSVCACHVHIGIADQELALRVSNHLRARLPVLVALAANSPFWQGRDTRYAGWRTITWARWPAAGPPPYLASRAHFEDLVAELTATGAIMDRSGLYWDVRPSHHVPTLEVRAADAASSVEDAVLLAALVRSSVATALADIEAGKAAFRPSDELLRAAYWRAARDGLSGAGVDLRTGRLAPAPVLVERFLDGLRPDVLRHDDMAAIRAGWARLRAHGNGADRQRAAHRARGRLTDVVDHLIRATTAARPESQGGT
ncbi:carboxylate-amine ligase [Streptomyces huiliensis]|uniref:carboxylate-amine ligase n=1 Tax=Streptomyces huiliensis TaxID=2876027 RepID=UPI001CC08E85|nr:glutamate--cysteine ligase [Streptomyces huiliensis]MBZ4319587.1 glutamate--cysteine ligase [Streptomyces huiliensis]